MTASLLFLGLWACGSDTEARLELQEVRAELGDLQQLVEFQQQSINALRGRLDASEEPSQEAGDFTLSVEQLAPGHVQIERAQLQQMSSAAPSLGRMLEHKSGDGTIDGFTLRGIRSGSPLARLGLSNGDVVSAINERQLLSISDGMAAYEALQGVDSIRVQFVRHGRPSTVTIDVVDAT